MRTRRLLRIELVVDDLASGELFYTTALGFAAVGRTADEVRLRLGTQEIALLVFNPPGAPYPDEARACDQAFQHFAMPVEDVEAAVARVPHLTAISTDGPQKLPARSGGATAFKFRDAWGHPLELIQFPGGRAGGIDHSAIVVADVERSIAFYRDRLGFTVAARQMNTGPEQDRLDGLHGTEVEVVALEPAQGTPHVELLAYRHPTVRPTRPPQPEDIAATRLVLEVDEGPAGPLMDPDGHHLVLVRG